MIRWTCLNLMGSAGTGVEPREEGVYRGVFRGLQEVALIETGVY